MDSRLHELSLILLGVALTKTDRDRVVSTCTPGTLHESVDPLIDAIGKNKRKPVVDWLQARGVTVPKGKDAIQSCIDAVVEDANERKAREMLSKLNFALHVEQVPELKARLRACLEALEAF